MAQSQANQTVGSSHNNPVTISNIDTVALAHSPEQVLANLVVEQKRHHHFVYDAAIAWDRHREAQAEVDKLLQTIVIV